MDVLKVLIIILIIVLLIFTWKLGKNQRKGKNEVSDDVVNHPVFRNPVFFTYVTFAVLLLIFIFIVASYFN
jgi:quinol-cytochrome oxidoreductase complex cytochrome b subunit